MANTMTETLRNTNSSSRIRTSQSTEQQGLLSGDRLLAVAELLIRADEPLSARSVADALEMNRTTTHRALNTLMLRGWVERCPDATGYRMSMRFWALAHVSTQGRSFLADIKPELERLCRQSRETVHVGVLDGFEILHVDKIDSPQRVGVSSKVGVRGPAHTASLGKALLAAGPESLLETYIGHALGANGEYRLHDAEAFRREMALTRDRGYSIDNEEDAIGVRCIGVAVVGAGDVPLFAISVTGPAARFTQERLLALAPDMMETGRLLSARFGGAPASPGTEPEAAEAW